MRNNEIPSRTIAPILDARLIEPQRDTAMSYREVYQNCKKDPEAFWLKAAGAIDWVKPPTRALFDKKEPFFTWFNDAVVNACWNALDRHVEAGRGENTAIIYDSPVTGAKRSISFAELLGRVSRLAGAMAAKGVSKGDRVIIYMPMIPEALEAMLACARLGAVHSVVFGGFAANELAVRITDAKPKCVLAASCGIEPGRIVEYKPLLDKAISISDHKPEFCVGRATGTMRSRSGGRARFRLERVRFRRETRRLHPGRRNAPRVHPLYFRDDRAAQRRPSTDRRPSGRSAMVDEKHLRSGPRRGLLDRLRRRMGRGPLLHLLRAIACRQHECDVRRQAGRNARRSGILAGHIGIRRARPVHRADSFPRDQEGRPTRPVHQGLRSVLPEDLVPCRGARRPRHDKVG